MAPLCLGMNVYKLSNFCVGTWRVYGLALNKKLLNH